MAKPRPSVQKRRNESRKMEKAQEKAARKAARGVAREARGEEAEEFQGVDADLAGIVAGPQPVIEEDPLAREPHG